MIKGFIVSVVVYIEGVCRIKLFYIKVEVMVVGFFKMGGKSFDYVGGEVNFIVVYFILEYYLC